MVCRLDSYRRQIDVLGGGSWVDRRMRMRLMRGNALSMFDTDVRDGWINERWINLRLLLYPKDVRISNLDKMR
jgi:hypothetical protein